MRYASQQSHRIYINTYLSRRTDRQHEINLENNLDIPRARSNEDYLKKECHEGGIQRGSSGWGPDLQSSQVLKKIET